MIKTNDAAAGLISENFVYSNLGPADIAEYFELFSDPRVSIPMGVRPLRTIEDAKISLGSKKSHDAFTWLIRSKEEGKFTGIFGLHNINWQHRCAQIGGGLLPTKWRKGHGLEIVKRLAGFAFAELSLHRIEGHLYPDNTPMKNLFIKAGFQVEGLLRENFFYEGKRGDTLIMGLLQSPLTPPAVPTNPVERYCR